MVELKPPEMLFPVVELPVLELPTEDGVPLETSWHRIQMNLLIDSVHYHWRDRRDYFVGGNMFVYFSFEQVRKRDYRGPDFFVVKGVDGERDRDAWIVWEEKGRYPDLIVTTQATSVKPPSQAGVRSPLRQVPGAGSMGKLSQTPRFAGGLKSALA